MARIERVAGLEAVARWRAWSQAEQEGSHLAERALDHRRGDALPPERALDHRTTTATAVRFTLQELATHAPGGSVEVRVPPFGAVQCIPGTSHRRGTPPAVIETDARTWLELATGRLSWADAVAAGRVTASGERADLAEYLPLA